MTQDVYDQAAQAQVFERGTFLQPGQYDLRIKRCIHKPMLQGGKGPAFIAEFEVLATSNPAHPIGSTVTWIQKMGDPKVGGGTLKTLVYAVYGKSWGTPADQAYCQSTIDPQFGAYVRAATDPTQQIFKGYPVHCEVILKKRRDGGDFHNHNFSPYTGAAGALPSR